jgi:hypothetical protein
MIVSTWIILSTWAGPAVGKTVPVQCQKAEDGTFLVDGVFTDWKGSTPTRLGSQSHIVGGSGSWSGAYDLSAQIHCAYTSKALHFLIKVRDEYVVRTPKLTPVQDHIAFLFKSGQAVRTLAFFPPDGRQKPAYGWLKKKRRRRRQKWQVLKQSGITAAVIRLPNGYGLELSLSNSIVPGYGPGSPAMNLSVQLTDADSKANLSVQTVLGTGGSTASSLGRVEFEGAKSLLNRFLRDRGLNSSAIKLHKIDNFVTGKSLERLVIAGRYMAMIGGDVSGGGYFFMTFPVRRARDVLRFAIKDMDGDGQPEVLVRLRQSGGNKTRELYLIFRYKDTGGFGLLYGQEVVHKMGPRLLTNKYRYIKKRRGWDMEFSVGKCVGWTKANHRAITPKNMQPILTPWSEATKVRYKFTSEGYQETD